MVHLEKINGIPDDFKNKLSFKELQAVDTAKTFHILVDENGKRVNDSYYTELAEDRSSNTLFVLEKYVISQYDKVFLKMFGYEEYEIMNKNYITELNCVIDPSDGYEYYVDKIKYTCMYVHDFKNIFVIKLNYFVSDINDIVVYSKINHNILYKSEKECAEEIYENENKLFIIYGKNSDNACVRVIDLEKAEVITEPVCDVKDFQNVDFQKVESITYY